MDKDVAEWLDRETAHYECEDGWYSCATICLDERRRSETCDCGADQENAIKAKLRKLLRDDVPLGDLSSDQLLGRLTACATELARRANSALPLKDKA